MTICCQVKLYLLQMMFLVYSPSISFFCFLLSMSNGDNKVFHIGRQ